MALIERVTTLLRANINELLDRAENPEVTLKQLVLDMENQLLQVKTQVAIALADQHLLERKALEQQQFATDWQRKAELAVSKGDDVLARAALQRALSSESNVGAYRAQMSDQAAEAEALRTSYAQLQAKLSETRAECDRLIAQHRRARMLANLAESRAQNHGTGHIGAPEKQTVGRVRDRLRAAEATSQAAETALSSEVLEERFADLEKADRVEKLLSDLKNKQGNLLPTA